MRECSRVPQESKNWCIFFDVRRPVLFKTFDIKKCLLNRRSGNSFWAKAKNAQSRQEPSVTSTGRSIDCISDVQRPVFVDDFWEKKCRINRRSGNIFWTVAKNFGTIFGQKQDMSSALGRTISRKLFRVTKSTAAVGMCSGDEESVEGRSVSNRIGITQPRSDDLSSWQDKSSSRKAESQ